MKAIILCAGVGRRFQPLSYSLPKPLTPVNNVPLLEQSVTLLRKHGVQRILVVTGYMAEAFAAPAAALNLELCYNPRFADTNNNTSLATACPFLMEDDEPCLIMDGDLYFCDDFFPLVRNDVSHFVSQSITRGLEWELHLDTENRVTSVDKWSPSGWGMVGVSCWMGEGARLLAEEVRQCAPDEYWEDAALRVLARTAVHAVCAPQPFVREIDCLADALDMNLLTHEEIARLCSVDFVPERLKGLTNNTWLIRDHQQRLRTLRVPGKGTERYIRREHEPVVLRLLEGKALTPDTEFFPGGFKTTAFLGEHRISTRRDCTKPYFAALAAMLHDMHTVQHTKDNPLKPLYIAQDIELYEAQSGRMAGERQRRWLLDRAREFDAEPQVLCHRDLLLENILVRDASGRDMQLIDFEYAGFTHPLWDAASFNLEAGIEGETRREFMRALEQASSKTTEQGSGQAAVHTGGQSPAESHADALWHMEILVDYVWGLWGLVNGYVEYGENRLHRANMRLQKILG